MAVSSSIGTGSSVSIGIGQPPSGGVSDGDKGDITVSGNGSVWTVDAVSESVVTAHNAAITITESQISDFGTYADASHTHGAGDVTSGTFADARIAESNVTQHQAALTITESQISDLGSYITDSGAATVTNKTIDADNNTVSNIGLAELDTDVNDAMDIFVGAFLDSPAVTVTESVGTVSANVEKAGGGDVRVFFSTGVYTWDCTPADTVALTAGTDTVPKENYIYLLESSKTLTASEAGWPSEEHAPVATVVCPSAAFVATGGTYKTHAWTDHVVGGDASVGHLAHINYWMRKQPATWDSGGTLTPTVGAATFDIAVAAAVVLQLHDHAFPAFNTATGSEVLIYNHPDTAYKVAQDLTLTYVDKDVNGTALGDAATDFYNLVIWGVVSEDSGDCKLMCNVPDGAYANNNGDAASNDDEKTAVYTIPTEYVGTGFLIARLTVQENGGTYTIENQESLLGKNDPSSAGGGSTGGNEFVDSVFRVQDDLDQTKQMAFQVSGVTTGTTRTFTVPDFDGTLATLAGTETLTNKTLTTPIVDEVHDSNGNEVAIFTGVASAVNEVTITNAATGNAPELAATGADTNIDLNIFTKGNGDLILQSGAGAGANLGLNEVSPVKLFHMTDGDLRIEKTASGTGDAQFELESDFPQIWGFNCSKSNGNFYWYDNTNGKFPFTVEPNSPSGSWRCNSSGVFGINTTADASSQDNGIIFGQGTGPTSNPSNCAMLWCEDDAGSARLYAEAEDGTVGTLTSHSMGDLVLRDDDLMPFTHRSHNHYTGKDGIYYLSAAIMALDEMLDALANGAGKTAFAAIRAKCEKLILINDIPVRDRAENNRLASAAAREKHIGGEIDKLVEIPKSEALELVDELEPATVEVVVPKAEALDADGELRPGVRKVGSLFKAWKAEIEEEENGFEVDDETGEVRPRKVRVPKMRASGRKRWECKPGCEFDKKTGKFHRKKTRAEVEADMPDFTPSPLPKWVRDRLPKR